jgi:DNA-directed RNA polymerase
MDLEEYQRTRENDAVLEAERQYLKEQARSPAARRVAWKGILSRKIRSLGIHIKKDQDKITNGKGPLPAYSLPMLALHSETLAIQTLRTIWNRILTTNIKSGENKLPSFDDLAFAIGKSCYWEWKRRRLEVQLGKSLEAAGLPDLPYLLGLRNKSSRNLQSRVNVKVRDFYGRNWLDDGDATALGGRILELAEQLNIIEVILDPISEGKDLRRVSISYEILLDASQIAHTTEFNPLLSPTLQPMLVKPRPWAGLHGGGFLTNLGNPDNEDLVKHRNHPRQVPLLETAAQNGELNQVCEAVNAMQETPWRINQRVYMVLQFAWRQQIALPKLPTHVELRKLNRVLKPLRKYQKYLRKRQKSLLEADSEVDIKDQKEQLQKDRTKYRQMLHSYECELDEQRNLTSGIARLKSTLDVCQEMEKCTQDTSQRHFYFPYQLDYRGRAYSMVSTLSPQGDDRARALLEFSDGKPLGEDGEFWLAVHVANSYGLDKWTFSERVNWVREQEHNIRRLAALDSLDGKSADDFLAALSVEGLEFWKVAKKPWSFLAACFEWADHLLHGFVSRLPVTLDASANGLQHLSALTRDEKGAEATNLLNTNRPQDIYERVSKRLEEAVEQDAQLSDEEITQVSDSQAEGRRNTAVQARIWRGKIKRTTVKSGVMTTFYGVTLEGRRQQIHRHIIEYYCRGHFEDSWKASVYLAKKLEECIKDSEEMKRAKKTMAWLHDVVDAISDTAGVWWMAPSGFPVVVEEHPTLPKRITWRHPDTGEQGLAKQGSVTLQVPRPELERVINYRQ